MSQRALSWEWWAAHGSEHVTPHGDRQPEGFDPGERAQYLLNEEGAAHSVVEIGCGDGRLAGAFDASEYVGLDVNEENLARARFAHTSHDFRSYEPWGELPGSAAVIAWAVLLHVPDDDLPKFVKLCAGRVVVIGESMSRLWRRKGSPPVYNRDPVDYESSFLRHRLAKREDVKLARVAHMPPPKNTHTTLVMVPK